LHQRGPRPRQAGDDERAPHRDLEDLGIAVDLLLDSQPVREQIDEVDPLEQASGG
jgi:hypothetical protein